MAKNRTMRVAVLMLALTLITSCFVGGTFAKYTTSGEAADSARVAKWGIVIDATSGDLFSNSYVNEDDDSLTTVYSTDADNDGERDLVVAPGTSGTGSVVSILGASEVATKVTIDLQVNDYVYLKFADDTEYAPVVFSLIHNYQNGAYSIAAAAESVGVTCTAIDADSEVITGSLADIQNVFAVLNSSMEYLAPGYVFDDTFELGWSWAFESSNDAYDTALGNLAANEDAGVEYTDYSTTIDYSINITIEQVD